MEKTLEELSIEILNEIEKEDFLCAVKKYGKFKIIFIQKKLSKWIHELLWG